MEHLEKSFRGLRGAWFNSHLYRSAHERVSETEEEEEYRNRSNKELKIKYDEDTEAIIRGESRALSPTCEYDMTRGRKVT